MIHIQKYKAKIQGTEEEVIGYITEGRKYLGNGVYHHSETSYLISVTEISMPEGGKYYGTFLVDPETIKPIKP